MNDALCLTAICLGLLIIINRNVPALDGVADALVQGSRPLLSRAIHEGTRLPGAAR